MSSIDKSRNGKPGRGVDMSQIPGLVTQHSPVEQLPFPDNPTQPMGVAQAPQTPLPVSQMPQTPFPASQAPQTPFPALQEPQTPLPVSQMPQTPFPAVPDVMNPVSSAGGTRNLAGPESSPGVSRQLGDAQTGVLVPATPHNSTAARPPVVIRGKGQKGLALPNRSQGKRTVISLGVTSFLVFIVLTMLVAVSPLGNDGHGDVGIFPTIFRSVSLQGNNTGLLAQQAATATAVTQDGFDAGANNGQYGGVPSAPSGGGGGGLGRFFYGQCTYWANMRYHQLTGVWVPWLGNANQWVSGAYANGWTVSGTPKVPSIIVLQGYVQGAGYYGHVAVVEGINADGSVHTSNWNWYANGGWARLSYWDFKPGSGVSFIWASGK